MELAPLVVDRIARRFESKVDDIRLMTESQSGFELWCTWEAYLACRIGTGWDVVITPRYDSETSTGTGAGDLRVSCEIDGDMRWSFIEMTLIHDGNRGNTSWLREKLRGDVEQLRCLPWEYDLPLLMIIDSSASGDARPHWHDYLDGLPVSRRLFHTVRVFPFRPSGRMEMYVFGVCRPGVSSE